MRRAGRRKPTSQARSTWRRRRMRTDCSSVITRVSRGPGTRSLLCSRWRTTGT
jgi:hypothetical protein